MRSIAIITSTRAEYGLLRPLIRQLMKSGDLDIRVVVTGMHLSGSFGNTISEIKADQMPIDECIEILLDGGTPNAVSKTMAIALMEFSNYFHRKRPDAVLVLGDRYEILAVCISAVNERIPVIHLCGGEVTEGAVDDAIRHSITKMSSLHFTITEEYRKRVIQLGENPHVVYNFGSLGNENIHNLTLLSKSQLEESIQFSLKKPYSVVTFHPATRNDQSSKEQFTILQHALIRFENMNYIITKANADAGGKQVNRMIDLFAGQNPERVYACESLGMVKYLSAVKYSEMVIGNSSSGIVEVPAFHIPTINIGNRQKGRIEAESVITCEVDEIEIYQSMKKAMKKDFKMKIQKMDNPYYKKKTSVYMANVIQDFLQKDTLCIEKKFFDVEFSF